MNEQRLLAEREAREEAIGVMKAKIEVARNLLAEGFAMDMIIKVTGLSEAEITKLLD